MISNLAQRAWKGSLVAGVLTAILGGMLLAWPGPSILVASVLLRRLPAGDRFRRSVFGVHLAPVGSGADSVVHRRRVVGGHGDFVV